MSAPQIYDIDFVEDEVPRLHVNSLDVELLDYTPNVLHVNSLDAEDADAISIVLNIADQYGNPVTNAECVVYYDVYKYVSRTNQAGVAQLYHSVGHNNSMVVRKAGYVTINRPLTADESNNSNLTLSLVMQRTDTPRLTSNNKLITKSAANKPSRFRKGQSWYFNLKAGDVTVDGSNRLSRANDYHGSAVYLANPTVDKQPVLTSEGLVFDTVNDWLRLEPNNFSLASTDFTIAFWVKTRATVAATEAKIVALTDNVMNIAVCSFKAGTYDVIAFTDGTFTYEKQMSAGFNHVAVTYTQRDNSIAFFVNGILIGSGINPVTFDFPACVLLFGNTPTASMGSTIKDIVVAKYAMFNSIGYSIGQSAFVPPLSAKERWGGGQFADLNVVDKSKVKLCLHSRTALAKTGTTVTSWVDTLTNKTYTASNGTATNDATGNGVVMTLASLLANGTVNIDMSKLDITFWYYQTATSGGILYLYSNATNNYMMKNTATGFDVAINGTVMATVVNALNAWAHVRVLMINGSLRVFVGGVLAASVASAATNTFSCTPRVGYLATAYLSGRIDALMIHEDLPFDPFSNQEMLVGRWYFTPKNRNSL